MKGPLRLLNAEVVQYFDSVALISVQLFYCKFHYSSTSKRKKTSNVCLRRLKFEMDRGIQLKNCAFDFRIEDFWPHKITHGAYI